VTDEVAKADGTPSDTDDSTTDEVVETAAPTETDADATYRDRLAGKDRALTQTIRERDAAQAKLRELEDWKAQQERGSMTEVERLRAELEERDQRLTVAQQEAQAAKLEVRFPSAYAATEGKLLDEAALAKLEKTLKAGESAAPVVSNSAPRRAGSSEPAGPKTSKELEAELRSMPNPYEHWGQ
jgi:hypothetical protein